MCSIYPKIQRYELDSDLSVLDSCLRMLSEPLADSIFSTGDGD